MLKLTEFLHIVGRVLVGIDKCIGDADLFT